jgi:hypothetical protein
VIAVDPSGFASAVLDATVDVNREATVVMQDADPPTISTSPSTWRAPIRSAFQTNSMFLRILVRCARAIKGSGPGAGHSKRIVVVTDFRSVMRDPVKRVAFIAESREKAAAERLDMVARREEWIGEAGFGATEGREMPSSPRRLLRRRKRCRGSGNRLAVRRQETIRRGPSQLSLLSSIITLNCGGGTKQVCSSKRYQRRSQKSSPRRSRRGLAAEARNKISHP